MAIRRIGQILVDLGFISDEQLEMLLEEQSRHPGELLGKIAEEMGLVTDEQIALALAEQMGLQVIKLAEAEIPEDVVELVTQPMAELYRVIPIKLEGNTFTVATCEPQNLAIQDELRTFLGYDIRLVVETESEIQKAINKYYGGTTDTVGSIVDEIESNKELEAAADALSKDGPIDITGAEALADSAPVRKLLNMVLLLAIKDHASDIH
ncbi:MAG: pilus assembly protein PilB, partial [Planctomycetales bacterium]|nr:pilus assembly protein PilB [Planctomycetales bacterium]